MGDGSRPETPAVKDEERAHPVASEWRSTFSQIVNAFVAGDYALSRRPNGVDPVSSDTVEQIRAWVFETDAGFRFKLYMVYVP